jgi:hypothetical protein
MAEEHMVPDTLIREDYWKRNTTISGLYFVYRDHSPEFDG